MDWLFNQYSLPEIWDQSPLWTPQEAEETDSSGVSMELKAALSCCELGWGCSQVADYAT